MAADILHELQRSGVRLRAEGDRLIAESDRPLTDDVRGLIRGNKPTLLRELSQPSDGGLSRDHEAAINRYLDHVGETDPVIRAKVFDACRQDPGGRAYFLERAREVGSDTDAVRARLLRDLKANMDLVRAAEVVDPDGDPVHLVVAIRGAGTCELLVDRQRWDPLRFLELVEAGGRPN